VSKDKDVASDGDVQQSFLFAAKATTAREPARGGGASKAGKASKREAPRSKSKTKAKAKTKKPRTKAGPKAARAKRAESDEAADVVEAPPEPRKRRVKESAPVTAETMSAKQRDISVSEFFAKNRHLLGFDNPAKALLTTVKELVDNSLDACDEARIPAEIEVKIDQLAEDRFRVRCIDNGPGIVPKNIPLVFGKLLYGSKFHRLKMSRGQQGIGVSAAGMYGLLTTGHPVRVISRTSPKKRAHLFEIAIDTQKNHPAVKREEEVDWEHDHGTQVEIELEASYRKGQHSVDNYILQISLANPHASIVYWAPDRPNNQEATHKFERVTSDLPPETAEIKPHPYGVELGVLMQMLRETKARNVAGFLATEFSRVSSRLGQEISEAAGIPPGRKPDAVTRPDAEKLHKTIAVTKIMTPPTDCIAPIGEELLERAMNAIHPAEFVTSQTRRPSVYRGNPFLIEVALAYGGDLAGDESALVYRYANRVPLQYQQGACAISRSVMTTDWKKYGLQHPKGALPVGPLVIMVHVASVWVPFTSESKEAVAHYPEIIKEIKLGLQDCGRRLGHHLSRRRRDADEAKKRDYIQRYIPHVAKALQEILGFDDAERDRTIETLTGVLERSRKL
jgi:DNA topoisomerase VI subunit B